MAGEMKVIVKIQNITDKIQGIPRVTVNNNDFQQREEITPKENPIEANCGL